MVYLLNSELVATIIVVSLDKNLFSNSENWPIFSLQPTFKNQFIVLLMIVIS